MDCQVFVNLFLALGELCDLSGQHLQVGLDAAEFVLELDFLVEPFERSRAQFLDFLFAFIEPGGDGGGLFLFRGKLLLCPRGLLEGVALFFVQVGPLAAKQFHRAFDAAYLLQVVLLTVFYGGYLFAEHRDLALLFLDARLEIVRMVARGREHFFEFERVKSRLFEVALIRRDVCRQPRKLVAQLFGAGRQFGVLGGLFAISEQCKAQVQGAKLVLKAAVSLCGIGLAAKRIDTSPDLDDRVLKTEKVGVGTIHFPDRGVLAALVFDDSGGIFEDVSALAGLGTENEIDAALLDERI